jgi:hypothetical protein
MVRWGLTVVAIGALAASSCALVEKSVQESVHYERSGDFPMPDVSGKTADEAKVVLALAGITGSIEVVDTYDFCPSKDETPQVDDVESSDDN